MTLSFRHYYWRWLKNQLFLFVTFAVLMTLARVSFAFYFGDGATLLADPAALRRALWLGFRYDLMPLAYVNALPFVLLNVGFFLPGKAAIRVLRALVIGILFTGYLLIGWLYVFDYGFYSYFQEHLNILFFGFFEDDTRALLITIWKNYNVPLWLAVLGFVHYGLWRLVRFLFSPFEFDLRPGRATAAVPATFVAGLALLALLARGNFGRLPLSLEDAHISENEFINEVALNGALTLNRAIKIRKTYGRDQYDYLKNYGFADWADAFAAVRGHAPPAPDVAAALIAKTRPNRFLAEHPPHVVLVVMESFGSYWDDADGDSFQLFGALREHLAEGVLFRNFLPAENGTIGSIVSVAVGQVIRPGARFLSESEYLRTGLGSAGHKAFQRSGYETHFVYGGKLGWRDLGKYLAVQGYDNLWGADEIKEALPELGNFSARDLGNEWGIFDEYVYGFIDEQLRTATKPQFFLVLSTSNHPPFEYPTSYQPRPLTLSPEIAARLSVPEEIARKRFLGLQYANQKMGEFLSRIKTSAFGEKTIVALTGDHSFWIAKGVGLEQEFRRYAVPFFLSIPEAYRPRTVDPGKFGSHEDIFPTLANLALSDRSYVKLGEDLFSDDGAAINSSGLLANEHGAIHHGKFWRWVDRDRQLLAPGEATPELRELQRRARGLIGLTDAYLKSEKSRTPPAGGNGRP
jgi:phosphoglycerol transferase MdoB-like AlkP superfamily enzyme